VCVCVLEGRLEFVTKFKGFVPSAVVKSESNKQLM
jgi:hypothetical protein